MHITLDFGNPPKISIECPAPNHNQPAARIPVLESPFPHLTILRGYSVYDVAEALNGDIEGDIDQQRTKSQTYIFTIFDRDESTITKFVGRESEDSC